jgi:phosphoribosyl-AMP cyclohydrolase
MAKSMLTLVDLDGLIYTAGYAGENRHYEVVFETPSGMEVRNFETALDVREFCAVHPKHEMVDKEMVVTPLPVAYSLKVVKNKLSEIQSRYGTNTQMYVKGNGVNFRNEVYTIQQYKGTRKTVKPYHYDAIVDYMVRQWNAVRVDNKEVDDEVALRAYESSKPVVVCSPDKDLDQIVGLHWNYTKAVEYTIDPLEARMFFWEQMLSGDSADNIMGVWKVGTKKAQALVDSYFESGYTDSEIWAAVVEQYELSQGMPTCPYKELDARDVAIQTGRGVWMQTKRNALWMPPNEEHEFMQIEDIEDEWF